MKTDFLQYCGHWWVFQICWHVECSTLTALSSRIWNSSTGIPSPPIALFVVMLSKAHLTSHSRMSGSRSVITPSWLSELWSSFLYSSSVYSCHLFLISSASVRSTTEQLHFHFSLSCIGEGNGNLLQCSCLENPRDGGAWWAAVYGVAQSQTRLNRFSSSSKERKELQKKL